MKAKKFLLRKLKEYMKTSEEYKNELMTQLNEAMELLGKAKKAKKNEDRAFVKHVNYVVEAEKHLKEVDYRLEEMKRHQNKPPFDLK